jgi:serine/threonine protein kinase
VAQTVITSDSITINWSAGSSLTASFLVYGRRLVNSRDLDPGNFTLLQNSSATSCRVGNLASGSFYTFRVQAISGDGSNTNAAEFTFQTASVLGGQGTLPPGGTWRGCMHRSERGAVLTRCVYAGLCVTVIGVSAGLIGGVAAALICIIAVLVVGFYVYKRDLQAKQKKLLDEYSAQLQMLTINRAGVLPNSFMGDMSAAALKANLQVPKTHFLGADATLLNTVMEVALPGFLLMDYSMDLRPEARLTAGGAGTIFRGSLLSPEAVNRNGGEVCAIKEVSDWPSLSDEDNQERFHQEVSIMWSLSFHANIIKLIGYTEEPRTIVTRLYPTDLFRYLHTQEDKTPLESHLLLHLCSGMVGALAAVHSMGIAHRDIKSPNFLLQEPRAGSPFPDPILCDFGLSRSSEDGKFDSIKGFSPRYSPPEVFARIHLRNSSNTVDDDKMSDIYSIGVVLWETMARQVPWDGISNEDIELHVRGGARVPLLEVDPSDGILMLLNGVIDNALNPSPDRRPTVTNINSKFANFIRALLNE